MVKEFWEIADSANPVLHEVTLEQVWTPHCGRRFKINIDASVKEGLAYGAFCGQECNMYHSAFSIQNPYLFFSFSGIGGNARVGVHDRFGGKLGFH